MTGPCSLGTSTPIIEPKRSPFFESLFGREAQRQRAEQAPLITKAIDHSEEMDIRVDMLKAEVDQHKQALIEKLVMIQERDTTIETQCFHILSLYQSLQEETRKTSELQQIKKDLETQLGAIAKQDWQLNSGRPKKRKLSDSC